jgi:uncharacterized protein
MPERVRVRLLGVLLLGVAARVCALDPGEPLPELRVEEFGELHLAGEEARYTPWQSSAVAGAMQVVQYMAARLSVKSLNEPFTDRLRDSGIPLERYHVTTIVNLDDALFGTRSMVLSELEKNKKRYFRSSIVADAHGLGLKAWQLQPSSSAIIVLGPDGRVKFFRDGAMTPAEIDHVLQMVRCGTGEQLALLEADAQSGCGPGGAP